MSEMQISPKVSYFMKKLSIDYSNVLSFINKDEVASYEQMCNEALNKLLSKTGKGNDFVGWVDYPANISENELTRIINAKNKIVSQSECLVVVGIGGSYLGAKAVIEALNNYFNKSNLKIVFVGNNMSSQYMKEVTEYLKTVDFSVNVISKSGKTLEPALGFRFVENILKEKYSDYQERVFVTTSNENSILHDLAVKEGYEEFYIPKNIGGRYSVFTAVGLLPIACAGYDIYEFVKGALASYEYFVNTQFNENDCLQYASIRNILYKNNKLMELLVTFEPKLRYVGEWWKQLFGESEGKESKGIFPASLIYSTDLHSLGQYVQDGERMLFETYINIENPVSDIAVEENEENLDELNYLAGKTIDYIKNQATKGTILAHVTGGVPCIVLNVEKLDEFNIGYLLYFFMLACGISGYLLDVNPFDQEGVEAYKKNMFALLGKK